ncbi:TetR family transcriptional regulator [Microbacterium sp. SS28]|uniref:TetR family transcriptional regulator n=1 Tax=Microbacterium sp. SS28 TaxID=2919948 RepID=UPI001FAA64A9|nr:TetR family transcriptional regulator [Microbacterium sp. SS28]
MAEAPDTPTAIVAQAAAALREIPFDEISYRALGDAVGVSERTVYRQFPTRSHLLEGVAAWIEAVEFPLPPFVTITQYLHASRARFAAFDASPAYAFVCARAASISPTGEGEPTFITRALVAMLATNHPSVNERDLRRVAASLRYFSSAQFWARMRTGFDMSAPEITQVFDRTVAHLLGDLFPDAGAERPDTARRLSA